MFMSKSIGGNMILLILTWICYAVAAYFVGLIAWLLLMGSVYILTSITETINNHYNAILQLSIEVCQKGLKSVLRRIFQAFLI